MTREELLAVCRKAPPIGQVKHEDFIDYIVVLREWKKVEGEWRQVESAYMAVDGKIAMASLDHRLQNKRLDFEAPQVLVNNDEELTLAVFVVSELYGRRHGIATSRKKTGSLAEQSNPWEVAETSAIGRALSTMGYGLLPGAGLASAEDMVRALAEEEEAEKQPSPRRARRPRPLSPLQREELVRLYRQLNQTDEAGASEGLNSLFRERFGLTLEEADRWQGQEMIAELKARTRKGASS